MYTDLIAEAMERMTDADARFEETGEWQIGAARSLITRLTAALAAIDRDEQDGRLVVLPCKVGDKVYEPYPDGQIDVGRINRVCIDIEATTGVFEVSDIGKTVFLTRAEAEAALGGASDAH